MSVLQMYVQFEKGLKGNRNWISSLFCKHDLQNDVNELVKLAKSKYVS